MKELSRKQNIHFFIQHIIAFAAIFITLGMIVISLLNATAYQDTDEQLDSLVTAENFIYDPVTEEFTIVQHIENTGMQGHQRPKSIGQIGYSTQVIFWMKDKKQLSVPSPIDRQEISKQVKFKDLTIGRIQELSLKDKFGQTLYFRSKLVKYEKPNAQGVVYVQVIANTNQIRESIRHFQSIVIWCMIGFWILSIAISFLLSRLSMRPLLAAWKKQQEFVENASHELRTPLAIIQNKLEALFTKPDTTVIENSESIATSLAEIRRLRNLTSDLLTLARRDSNDIQVNKEETDVVKLFTDLTNDYHDMAELDDKDLTFKVNDETLTGAKFSIDPTLTRQLLVILLDNALKYTSENESIEVVLEQTKQDLLFYVMDTGVGIPDDKKEAIFERFVRVDSSRNKKTGGFGLGLSIASQIVSALNGKIIATDNTPKGTILKVTLPK